MGVKMSPSSIMAPDLVTNCPWRGFARQARKPVLSRISHSLQPAFLLSSHCSILPLLWALIYSFSLALYGGTVLCARSPICFQTREQRGIDSVGGRETQGEKQMLLRLLSNWGEPITIIKVKSRQKMDFCICQPVNKSSSILFPNTLLCDTILAILLAFQIVSTTSNILTKSLVCTLYL